MITIKNHLPRTAGSIFFQRQNYVIILTTFKNPSLQINLAVFNTFVVNWINICSNEGPCSFPRAVYSKMVKVYCSSLELLGQFIRGFLDKLWLTQISERNLCEMFLIERLRRLFLKWIKFSKYCNSSRVIFSLAVFFFIDLCHFQNISIFAQTQQCI